MISWFVAVIILASGGVLGASAPFVLGSLHVSVLNFATSFAGGLLFAAGFVHLLSGAASDYAKGTSPGAFPWPFVVGSGTYLFSFALEHLFVTASTTFHDSNAARSRSLSSVVEADDQSKCKSTETEAEAGAASAYGEDAVGDGDGGDNDRTALLASLASKDEDGAEDDEVDIRNASHIYFSDDDNESDIAARASREDVRTVRDVVVVVVVVVLLCCTVRRSSLVTDAVDSLLPSLLTTLTTARDDLPEREM